MAVLSWRRGPSRAEPVRSHPERRPSALDGGVPRAHGHHPCLEGSRPHPDGDGPHLNADVAVGMGAAAREIGVLRIPLRDVPLRFGMFPVSGGDIPVPLPGVRKRSPPVRLGSGTVGEMFPETGKPFRDSRKRLRVPCQTIPGAGKSLRMTWKRIRETRKVIRGARKTKRVIRNVRRGTAKVMRVTGKMMRVSGKLLRVVGKTMRVTLKLMRGTRETRRGAGKTRPDPPLASREPAQVVRVVSLSIQRNDIS